VRRSHVMATRMPTFDRIPYRGHDGSVFLCVLIELNGDDDPQGHASQRLGQGRRRTA
jgi:hypothetical protein